MSPRRRRNVYRVGEGPEAPVLCNGVEYSRATWEGMPDAQREALIHQPSLGLPMRYRTARFRDFPDRPTFRSALPILQRFVLNHHRGAGIYLHGPVGVGKTHLAAAAMAELRLAGGNHRWLREDDFFATLWDRQREGSDAEFFRELLQDDVVVFDDLFASLRWNDWKREQLDRLIHVFYDARPVLFATSNTPPDKIDALEVLSERSLSRLREMLVPIGIEGLDRRTRPRRPLPATETTP